MLRHKIHRLSLTFFLVFTNSPTRFFILFPLYLSSSNQIFYNTLWKFSYFFTIFCSQKKFTRLYWLSIYLWNVVFYILQIKNSWNKTSIQWTPGSQIYLSSMKIIFGQKWIFEQKNQKAHKLCIISWLLRQNGESQKFDFWTPPQEVFPCLLKLYYM